MRESWRQAAENAYRQHFRTWWSGAFDAKTNGPSFTLLGPSTYLLDVGGTRIVIDPVFRYPWMEELVEPRWKNDLSAADAILFTHQHGDHYDPKLVKKLAGTGAKVIIPDFFPHEPFRNCGFCDGELADAIPWKSFSVKSMRITPFPSVHTRPVGQAFYPEYGYMLETEAGVLLFPCDVRNYDTALFPKLPNPDWLFLHVWLKGGNSQNLPCEPYLSEFARFAAHFSPKHISLAHLYEFARTPDEMWTYAHAGLCTDAIQELLPETEVVTPRVGQTVLL